MVKRTELAKLPGTLNLTDRKNKEKHEGKEKKEDLNEKKNTVKELKKVFQIEINNKKNTVAEKGTKQGLNLEKGDPWGPHLEKRDPRGPHLEKGDPRGPHSEKVSPEGPNLEKGPPRGHGDSIGDQLTDSAVGKLRQEKDTMWKEVVENEKHGKNKRLDFAFKREMPGLGKMKMNGIKVSGKLVTNGGRKLKNREQSVENDRLDMLEKDRSGGKELGMSGKVFGNCNIWGLELQSQRNPRKRSRPSFEPSDTDSAENDHKMAKTKKKADWDRTER